MNWFSQSVVATVLLAPCWLAVGFFDRNFGVRPNVFVVWYFLGISLSVAAYTAITDNHPTTKILPSFGLVLAVLLIGATIGAAANLLLFTAVANAPNPSLPSAVANGGGSALVFFLAVALAMTIPKYFEWTNINWAAALMGLALIIAGIWVLAYAKR